MWSWKMSADDDREARFESLAEALRHHVHGEHTPQSPKGLYIDFEQLGEPIAPGEDAGMDSDINRI